MQNSFDSVSDVKNSASGTSKFDNETCVKKSDYDVHAQKHMPNITSAAYSATNKKQSKVTRSVPCTYYNQGTCIQQKTHETRGGLIQTHLCFMFRKY